MYRPNVAGLLSGRTESCWFANVPGREGWGIDPGKTALETIEREVREEIGFLPFQCELVESRGGYRYDYPPGVLDYVREKRQ
ncbi:NUDIX domain-containing protein [Akkermansia sp.]|uniref:NUDIX domain-containing protein n=1 Tax=Akkermansia sp. TaxID=1872421 RepID=UPI003AB40C8E